MSAAGHAGDGHDDEEHEEHEEHVNHEAWVIPYADLLTLLMAMFIALFAISNVDMQKFKKLAEGFNQALHAGGGQSATIVDLGGSGEKLFLEPIRVLADGAMAGLATAAQAEADPASRAAAQVTLNNLSNAIAAAEESAQAELTEVEQIIDQQAGAAGIGSSLQTKIDERGLVITVVTDEVVFSSGSAEFGTSGASILGVVGSALATVDNPIRVEGHTDDIPISTPTFPSNWELSSARAGAVVRYFETAIGLPPGRFEAAGFADTHPIDSNDSEAGRSRNRRVEVIVESDAQQRKDRILEEAVQATERLQRPDPGP